MATGKHTLTPEASFDSKHEDHITDVQWDYYARRLATASLDRTVKIFAVAGSQHVQEAVLTGHDGPVWECAWGHPQWGSIVASCSYDGTVLVFKEEDRGRWSVVHKWSSGDGGASVNGIEFAPSEHGALMLACASSDGYVTILVHHGAENGDVWTSHRFPASQLGCNAVSWGPAGAIGAKMESDDLEPLRLVTGSCDNKVKFWRAKPPDPSVGGLTALATQDASLHFIEEPSVNDGKLHTEWVRDVAWAPFAGIPASIAASCSEDKTVYIWERNHKDEPWTPKLVNTFEDPVWRVNWSVFGSILAVSSGDEYVSLWKEDVKKNWHQLGTGFDSPADADAAFKAAQDPPPASE